MGKCGGDAEKSAFDAFQRITTLEISINHNQFPDKTYLERQIGGLYVHHTQTFN